MSSSISGNHSYEAFILPKVGRIHNFLLNVPFIGHTGDWQFFLNHIVIPTVAEAKIVNLNNRNGLMFCQSGI